MSAGSFVAWAAVAAVVAGGLAIGGCQTDGAAGGGVPPFDYSRAYPDPAADAARRILAGLPRPVADALARVPSLTDGIDARDRAALEQFARDVAAIDGAAPGLFDQRADPDRFPLAFRLSAERPLRAVVSLQNINSMKGSMARGHVADVAGIGLEPEDAVDPEVLAKGGLRLDFHLAPGDVDGARATLHPRNLDEEVGGELYADGRTVRFAFVPRRIMGGKMLVNGSAVTLEIAGVSALSAEQLALRDIVTDGVRHSAPLEAAIAGYKRGLFGDGRSPFAGYGGPVAFMERVYGPMKTSAEWDHPRESAKLMTPELIRAYQEARYHYNTRMAPSGNLEARRNDYSWSYLPTHEAEGAHCDAFSANALHHLRAAGYEARVIGLRQTSKLGNHLATVYRTPEGWFVLDRAYAEFHGEGDGIRGPFKDVYDVKAIYGASMIYY